MEKLKVHVLLAGLALCVAFFSCTADESNPGGEWNGSSSSPGPSFPYFGSCSSGPSGFSSDSGPIGPSSPSSASSPSSGSGGLDFTRAHFVNNRLGKGVNLGNAFDAQCRTDHGGSGSCPTNSLNNAMTGTPSGGWSGCWSNPIQSGYFSNLKSQGFKSIRLPIRWAEKASDTSPYTIPPGFMSAVKDVADQAIGAGLPVIINIHHFNELFDDCNGRGHIANDFNNQQKKLVELWRQIANEFKTYSNDDLVFEILNEPHGRVDAATFNSILGYVWPVIRETNPGRTIMINSANWGKLSSLASVTIPRVSGVTDQNVILSGHYYEPQCFTHYNEGSCTGGSGISTWGTSAADINTLRNDIQSGYNSVQTKYPGIPVNIGEFGTTNRVSDTYRAAWLTEAVKKFNELNLSWHWWAFPNGGWFDGYTCVGSNCSTGSWKSGFEAALKQP